MKKEKFNSIVAYLNERYDFKLGKDEEDEILTWSKKGEQNFKNLRAHDILMFLRELEEADLFVRREQFLFILKQPYY